MNLWEAFKKLNSIYEEDFSQKRLNDLTDIYTEYINTHKENVKKSFDWFMENLPELFEDIEIEELQELIDKHDESKFSEEEFLPYANRWFGDKKKTKEYGLAWEHHWKNNLHHPEYWDGEDMEYIYILEMLCDWMSFGFKENNLKDIVSFYWEKAREDKEKNLSKNTKKILDAIINKIDNKTN